MVFGCPYHWYCGVRTLKARWSRREGVLGETFSGRLGDYMVSCMARLKRTRWVVQGKRMPGWLDQVT
jgi:hypothetical protein